MLLIIFFLLSLLLLGFSSHLLFKNDKSQISLTFFICFEMIILGIIFISIISIILLELSSMRIYSILLISLITSICFFLITLSINKKFPKVLFHFKISKTIILLIIILILASFFRLPTWNWICGGQDQGAYVNNGNYIARTGKIIYRDTVFTLLKDKPNALKYYQKNTNIIRGFNGIYLGFVNSNIWYPHGFHLMPIWFAISNLLLGVQNTTFPLYLFSILSIILIFILAKDFTGNNYIGLLSALLMAVNPILSFFSKFPVSILPGRF